MHEIIVKVENLTKRYPNLVAVDNISFTLRQGSNTALLGGNGAGKTTTISMLLGLLLPTSGSITVLGHDMLRDRYAALRHINFSSPYVDLPMRLSVRENLQVYGRLYGVANLSDHLASLAQDLALTDLLDRPYGSLSAGQKTRVSIAKSLINQPQLMLLDEPTASLDPDTADWVRSYITAYQRRTGASILMASHNMQEVERMCDNVLIMRAGHIVDEGAPAALIAKYGRTNMEEVFLHIARDKQGAA